MENAGERVDQVADDGANAPFDVNPQNHHEPVNKRTRMLSVVNDSENNKSNTGVESKFSSASMKI